MPEPAYSRKEQRIFGTPRVEDVLFYDLVDVSRVCPTAAVTPPAYGEAHPRTGDFPNFRLCLIEDAEVDREGVWQKWWYIQDRDEQESYNYSITYPYGGATQYPRITQVMVLRRGDNRLDPGTEWAGDVFDGAVTYLQPSPSLFGYLQPSPSTDSYEFPAASGQTPTLVAQQEEQLPYDSRISSLYVKVTRIYDVIPGVDDYISGAGTFQVDGGYTVTRLRGEDDFLRLVWKINLPRTIADANRTAALSSCPITPYNSLLLVDETIVSSDEDNQISTVTRVYEGEAIEDEPFPSVHPVQYQGKFYPGSMPPEKFIVSYRVVEDEYEISNPAQNSVATPATSPYAAVPNVPRSDLQSVEVKPDNVIRGKKVVKCYTDLTLQTLSGESWDDNLKDYVPYTTYAILSSAVSALGAPEEGTERTITPYNATWSVVVVEAPNSTLITSGDYVGRFFENISYGSDQLAASLAASARSYVTMVPAQWPQVLKSFRWGFAPNGRIYVDYHMKEEWSGLCMAVVTVGWTKRAPAWWQLESVPAMQPTALNIDWPGVGSIYIPPCLHYNADWNTENRDITGTLIGGEGAFIFNAATISSSFQKVWEATLPLADRGDWPNYIVKEISVSPYKGGFRLEKVVVYKPY